jgi:hypothetical protein
MRPELFHALIFTKYDACPSPPPAAGHTLVNIYSQTCPREHRPFIRRASCFSLTSHGEYRAEIYFIDKGHARLSKNKKTKGEEKTIR